MYVTATRKTNIGYAMAMAWADGSLPLTGKGCALFAIFATKERFHRFRNLGSI